jgi:arylsulfatase A-like enzyme
MKHPCLLLAAAFVLAALAPAATAAETVKALPPSILLILADDMGWGDVRAHGNDRIDTPVLDKLAADGVRFDRFFVSPVCAPTRASLLTGRHHLRTGACGVTRGLEAMRGEEVTLAKALRAAGYATGCFGKWHNGVHYPHHPNGQGFDEFLGFCAGHWNNYFDTTLEHNGKPAATKGYITDVLTDAAQGFIEKHRDRPFFCYVPYNAPHSPFQVPDRYFDKYKGRSLDNTTACIYGMVENIDDNIGRLLKKLDQLKLVDRTIVIFASDNGPNTERTNGGMKGRKGSVDEGGTRVPLFIRWPGRLKAGATVSRIAAHYDLFPTLVELCGLERPKTLPLDGVSLVPLLHGNAAHWPDRKIFTIQSRIGSPEATPGSVRTQDWRATNLGKSWQLYDMRADPGQKWDVAGEHPQVVKELAKAYDAWFQEAGQGIVQLPIPVGYPEAPLVELPAPECALKGTVKYKDGGWANDWLTNWTSTDDRIEWQIDVVREGRYDVRLLYCCPEKDIGAKLRVRVGGRQVDGTLRQAHDPAPLPSPDRVPRKEVYEKRWATLQLGQVKLAKGAARVTVQALTIPGRQVAELKAVQLQRRP